VKFEAAVRATPDIAAGCCPGLQALKGEHRSRVKRRTAQCHWRGSVDLETHLSPRYPGNPQWDYAVGYGYGNRGDGVAYVEVHPASSYDVDDVIRKKDWLTAWMLSSAPALSCLPRSGFFWVPTGRVRIHPGTPQHKHLAQRGITLGRVAVIG